MLNKINIRRLYYRVRHDYLTRENMLVIVALVIAASWVWGSLTVMQRNYDLQRELDQERQQLTLVQLQVANEQLQQNYYNSSEYQELSAREDLGLAQPGESLLVLPPNSQAAINADKTTTTAVSAPPSEHSNSLELWFNFLFGSGNKQGTTSAK